MKYKKGDKVKIKSLEWYNANKDKDGKVFCGKYDFIDEMIMYCGDILTIETVHSDSYDFTEDLYRFIWTDEMIEGLALEKGSELPSVVYIPYIIEDSPLIETSTEMCPKIEVPTRYYDEVKYEPKMVSLEDVCEWMKNTIDDDVLVKCGSVIKCMDVDDFVLYFRKAMEE